MLCPYCKIEYSSEQPCFCHPAFESKHTEPEEGNEPARSAASVNVAWNSHRGVRLD